MSEFDSPLRVMAPPAFDFGTVVQGPELVHLRWEMNRHLFRLVDDLPGPLADEVHLVLSRYSGGDGDFFRLFYTPAWSFLHWVAPRAPGVVRLAQETHALSLFLHLWDDHLCDGQLTPDLLRIHLRTLAWSRFVTCAEQLCWRLGGPAGLVAEHVADYLASRHHPEAVTDLEGYSLRSITQMRICTVVPLLLGGEALCRIVEEFGIAWRLLDDLQDLTADAMVGEKSAVWVELGVEGRCHWEGPPVALPDLVRQSGCQERLLGAICRRLAVAASLARSAGWMAIARELERCGQIAGPT